ncbi:MAG: tRNA uridine(34) 5-carboxymethylaminomethyl modification radical SAM/GNAT enzyme Elp3 [Nanoarchaeota archaeon]|nr:tRNA uridine(34) 5-carboxymethylaminomethyl modification radical SAM/GNAT enzyme Elp3 [Nanoarchaeota archaeon]
MKTLVEEHSEFYPALISWIKKENPSKETLARYKLKLCKQFSQKHIPTDIEIYLNATSDDASKIRAYLTTKPMRTGSGVAVVATMTKPYRCPHGACTFCPGGLGSVFGDVPMSYTGNEPSTMRGMRNDYDAYRIVFNRLEQYIILGQNCDKVDQIIMGGTFTGFPPAYREEYIHYSFKAYNDFSRMFFRSGKLDLVAFKKFFELPGKVGNKDREARVMKKVLARKEMNVKNLKAEQKINETAAIRCIGLTIETKPDWGFAKHGLVLLKQGVTRIELGVQTIYDEVLARTHRGHTISDTHKSIADLRDLGFKLNFHVMPGLPGKNGKVLSRAKDMASLEAMFTDEAYMPDMIKIYPCMVMPGTPMYDDYKKGIFKPISTADAASIIVDAYRFIPEWCRVMRVQRDIPTNVTEAGVDKTNLRQYVDKLAEEEGVELRDIRAREIGLHKVVGKPALVVREYMASGGKEFFISMEANDKILGFCRLRMVPRSLHPAITLNSAMIRELHVYGGATAIGTAGKNTQHKGVGRKLMAMAEEIAKRERREKILVISGVGAREYYRKLGYSREDCYMVKEI